MKLLEIEDSDIEDCVNSAQSERVVITRDGKPLALLTGLDSEQLAAGADPEFWKMIRERQSEPSADWNDVKVRLLEMD
ncbi:MAG: hypothetical protein K1X78_16675 [Verrucomicrobiaceae bacterium]|nr:hypothetical protein [Verrucomicrobiaceae bacterium]